MLAIFQQLLQSNKLSQPRLQWNQGSPAQIKKKSSAANKERAEQAAATKKAEEFKKLGIIETASGLEYHPIQVNEPHPKEKKPQVKRSGSSQNQLKKRQKETAEVKKKMMEKTPCKFYKKGRCTNSNCPYLHEGPPPLCYSLLKTGSCDNPSCIYNHDTKTVGCMFFHIMHNCTRGENCRFSHEALTEEQMAHLKSIYDELELEKQSTMPVEVAKAMLNEESEKKEASFENVPSLMTPEPESQDITKADVEAAASSEEENVEGVATDDLFF